MRSVYLPLLIVAAFSAALWADNAPTEPKPAPASQPYAEEGFTPIFNGKDIDDWVYGTKNNGMKQGVGYQVDAEKGIVYCTVKDGGNLYTKKEYSNFILRFDFK